MHNACTVQRHARRTWWTMAQWHTDFHNGWPKPAAACSVRRPSSMNRALFSSLSFAFVAACASSNGAESPSDSRPLTGVCGAKGVQVMAGLRPAVAVDSFEQRILKSADCAGDPIEL